MKSLPVCGVAALLAAGCINATLQTATAQPEKPNVGENALQLQPAPRSGKVSYIFAPGETVVLNAILSAAGDGKTVSKLSWSVRDLNNKAVASGEAVTSVQNRKHSAEIRYTPKQSGIYYVSTALKNDDGSEKVSSETRVAVFQPREKPFPIAPFVFGVNTALERVPNEEMEREVELIRTIGFPATRHTVTWSRVQANEGPFDWAQSDRIMEALGRNGVVPLTILGYSAKWASTGPTNTKDWNDWGKAPPRVEPYVKYARQAVSRYKKYTRFWEIWNEPDINFWRGTAEQYAEVFDASIKAIRQVDPNALVMNGGFSETYRRPDFIPTLLKQIKTKPDIYAHHSHGRFTNLTRALNTTNTVLKEAGWSDVPIWMNEAGFSTIGSSTERDQAELVAKKMAYTASQKNYTGYVWYDLRNGGTDPKENEHNFGLVRRDFSPKASIVAANTTLRYLAGKKFVKNLELGSQTYASLFADSKETVLALWGEIPAGSTIPQLLKTDAAGVQSVGIMGNSTSVPFKGGFLGLAARREPQFIVLQPRAGTTSVSVVDAGRILDLPVTLNVSPRSAKPVQLRLSNPLATRLQGTAAFTTDAGWQISPAQFELNLAPGEEKMFPLQVTPTAQAGRVGTLRVKVSSPALPQLVEADTQLKMALRARPLVNGQWDPNAAPLAVLEDGPQLVSLFIDTPMRDLHFRGAEDLSAQVDVAGAEDGIHLRVRVRDDIHAQTETLREIWKGDSLHFSILASSGQQYEWTAALGAEGVQQSVQILPRDFVGKASMDVKITREGTSTIYDILIPARMPGIKESLQNGCTLSFAVNDNDGKGRKGWLEWTPGIVRTKEPSQFQAVVFK